MGSERKDDDNSSPNIDNTQRGYIELIPYRVLFQVLYKCSQPLHQFDESRYYRYLSSQMDIFSHFNISEIKKILANDGIF